MEKHRFCQNNLFLARLTRKERRDLEIPIKAELGGKIREARQSAKGNLSLERFAEMIGVRKSQLQKYQDGKDWPNLYMIARIAKFSEKPLSFFIPLEFFSPGEVRMLNYYHASQDVK